MRKILPVLLALLLAGCVGTPPRQTEIARRDLGDLAGAWDSPGFGIAGVDVRAASWLDTPDQMYRLAYADPLRRLAYTESRWVAPPAELLERFLRRRIVYGQPDSSGTSGAGCRLALTLDELEQRFAAPRDSATVLEARAALLPPRGKTMLAKRAFLIRRPAPTPDAHGGVEGARAAAQALASELSLWLGELARTRPQSVFACKEAP
ncbi:MAG: ABC-type transport auxiliary lipoprotein family protein [Pseudomonadota bacterium]